MVTRTCRRGAGPGPAASIISVSCFVVTNVVLAVSLVGAGEDALDTALQNTPVRGGLCVVTGSTDAALATRLAKERPFLVNMLATNPAATVATRNQLLQAGLYGCVTIEEWAGPNLPYADNVISVLIVMDKASLPESECLRALRPGGELLVKEGATFRNVTKPRPSGMDEWNQWRHGPDRNPVSKDLLVDVPQRIQWLSTQGKDGKETKEMVTANGRSFYLAGKNLLARDAFNGLPLWSTAIDPRCTAVASGDNVFVVSKGELRCLNAPNGKQARTYPAGMPLGALKHDADRAADLVEIVVPREGELVTPASFRWKLRLSKFKQAARRDGHYILRTNVRGEDPRVLWQRYIQLTEIEAAFKCLKSDLAIRPVFHQVERRVEAHIFVAFLAYCLTATLRQWLTPHAPGWTPKAALETLAGVQMVDVWLPTTDGRWLVMPRYTQPQEEHQLLLEKLRLSLPAQPPPRIHASQLPPSACHPR